MITTIELRKYAPGIDMVKAQNIKSELDLALQSEGIIEMDFEGILAIQTTAARFMFRDIKDKLGEKEYKNRIVKINLSRQVYDVLKLVGV